MSDSSSTAKALLDVERSEHLQVKEKKALRISKVATEIEAILIRDDMTWGEWGEVVELFSNRIGHFVSNIKINFPK